MWRTILIYAGIMAAAAFALEWLQFQHLTRAYSVEIYIILIAIAFTVLGAWVGMHLTRGPRSDSFEKNTAALASLGVSDREYEVLTLLADGQTNKEIARTLEISPNTVKTHIAKLYEKLSVQRRTQAVQKARELALIP
ncbi:MAG: response regulator transcription factor [Aquisalinus sp.]|nr:response regulator transcription factor [Aquisalinus sp.]